MLVVTPDAYNRLKPRTKEELLAAIFPTEKTEYDEDFEWDNRVDLSPSQVEEFMKTLNDETKAALKIIAERGPQIHASLLDRSGISDYAAFQRSTTRRTRTITGSGENFLLAWDDWREGKDGVGRYAVTPVTFRSLRAFFNLDL